MIPISVGIINSRRRRMYAPMSAAPRSGILFGQMQIPAPGQGPHLDDSPACIWNRPGIKRKSEPYFVIRAAFSLSNHHTVGNPKLNSGSFSGRPNRFQ